MTNQQRSQAKMKLTTALASIALTLTVISGTASISQALEIDCSGFNAYACATNELLEVDVDRKYSVALRDKEIFQALARLSNKTKKQSDVNKAADAFITFEKSRDKFFSARKALVEFQLKLSH